MTTIIRAMRHARECVTSHLRAERKQNIVVDKLHKIVETALGGAPLIGVILVGSAFGNGRKVAACTIPVWLMIWDYINREDDSPSVDPFHAESDDIAQLLLDEHDLVSVEGESSNVVVGPVVLENTNITERRVRSLHSGRRARYLRALVAEAKVRFGTPSNTEANRVVVRRFIVNRMETHGLRVTHIAQVVDLVIEAVMIMSERERYARRMRGPRCTGEGGI